MKDRNCYGLIHIGLCIRLLSNVKENTGSKFVCDHINQLLNGLKKASFQVSLAGGYFLRNIVKDLSGKKNDTKIGHEIFQTLENEMTSFERIVYSEAVTKKIYVISQKRFNSEYLSKDPGKLFKPGVYDSLSELARFDISSACRCLLFGEGTAVAFHILRATEETLKCYYFFHKKRNRLSRPIWGPMTDQLRSKARNKPSSVILQALDLVRISYRNPTQHPEAIYDIESAQDLVGVCLDLINKMAQEIKKT